MSNMEEVWKDIVGYEGLYEISSIGRVKSVDRISPQGHHLPERIRKPYIDKDGYPKVNLCKEGKVIHYPVHRLVAIAFVPNPENKPQVNHIDGNKANNCVANLEWNTDSENMLHAFRTGLKKPNHISFYGECNPHCKVLDEDIPKLIEDFNFGMSRAELTAKYGIGKTQMYRIVKGIHRSKGSEKVYADQTTN